MHCQTNPKGKHACLIENNFHARWGRECNTVKGGDRLTISYLDNGCLNKYENNLKMEENL
jgi:hypothetical protein